MDQNVQSIINLILYALIGVFTHIAMNVVTRVKEDQKKVERGSKVDESDTNLQITRNQVELEAVKLRHEMYKNAIEEGKHLQEVIKELQKQVDQLEADLTQTRIIAHNSDVTVKSLTQSLENANDIITRLEVRIKTLSEELLQKENAETVLLSTIEIRERLISELKTELKNSETRCKDLQSRIEEMQTEIESLKLGGK